jgi:hypothetical protein
LNRVFVMPQTLVQPTALLAAITRSVLSNTIAGLITAVLLGYWMPMERSTESVPEQAVAALAGEPARVNVDPVSGKLLDRIEGAMVASVGRPVLSPILTLYGFKLASSHDAPAAAGASQVKSAPMRAGRPVSPKINEASGEKPVRPTVPAGPELSDAPPAPQQAAEPEESASWARKLSPARLTDRIAMGRDLAVGVASKAAGAGRAVIDRLAALGLSSRE